MSSVKTKEELVNDKKMGLEKQWSCPICHSSESSPHIIVTCGHTFCETCLGGVTNSECPTCRRRFIKEECIANYALFSGEHFTREKGLKSHLAEKAKAIKREYMLRRRQKYISQLELCFDQINSQMEESAPSIIRCLINDCDRVGYMFISEVLRKSRLHVTNNDGVEMYLDNVPRPVLLDIVPEKKHAEDIMCNRVSSDDESSSVYHETQSSHD